MCECVPIKIIHDLIFDTIEYTAISDHFRVLKEGEVVPLYQVLITVAIDRSVKIKFEEEAHVLQYEKDRELFDLFASYPTL